MKEMKELEDCGIFVCECLLLFEVCLLIFDYYVVLDNVCEKVCGVKVIGIIGCGIGFVYEDKVVCCGLCVGDFFDKEIFVEKLKEVMEYYNFQLVNYYKVEVVDYQKVLDDMMVVVDILIFMVVDVFDLFDQVCQCGDFVMFEGVQGMLLDIDYGIYLYVIFFNIIVGGVVIGFGLGLCYVDYVLGIFKVYFICVGVGLFLIELFDEIGEFFCKQGNEFGVIMGCCCCIGWLDIVVVCCVVQLNFLFGFCLIKLDVLDGLKEVKFCVVYCMLDGCEVIIILLVVDDWKGVELIYEIMLGWFEFIFGVKDCSGLLQVVLNYIKCIEELIGVLIDIIFIGSDCIEIMILCDLFDV